MAFVLKKTYSYTWPVKFQTPASGGMYDKHSFDAEFERLSDTRLKELLNSKDATDNDFTKEVLIGWTGIKDESGAEIPFSESALTELLEVPGMASAVVKTYLDSIAGAKAKN